MNLQFRDILIKPILTSDLQELESAGAHDEIWTNTIPINKYSPSNFKKWFDNAIQRNQKKDQECFVISQNSQLVGSSSFYNINNENKSLAIGYTWYTPSSWGTTINPICKMLLIHEAMSRGIEEIYFHTDIRNLHSRAAIAKLGALEIEVIPNHKKRPDGTMLDTVVFLIRKNQMQDVLNKLKLRL